MEEQKNDDEQAKLSKLLDKVEKNKLKRALQRQKKKEEKVTKKLNAKKKLTKAVDSINTEIFPLIENDKNEAEAKADEPKALEGFEILSSKRTRKQKVKRVLPRWLRDPTVIKTNLTLNGVKITGLDKSFKAKLKENGVKQFFPVQAEVIPYVLKSNSYSDVVFPRDICVSAPTGSGKTLAFVLPIVQALKKHVVKKIRALVILPTQDLALQVFQCFKTYTQDTNLSTLLITGSTSFDVEQKQLVYESK